MQTLFPHLAFDPVETPVSFAARLAEFHLGGGLMAFLQNIGVKADDLKTGANGAIEALCAKADVDPSPVLANTARRVAKRQYDLRGHTVSEEFLCSPRTKYCPACLLEDDTANDGRVGRRMRMIWTLHGVRTCPVHGIALLVRPDEVWDDKYQNVNCCSRFPAAALKAQVTAASTREVSPLQSYLIYRLDGATGPAWLDDQSIEQAQWATEMLGAVVAFGLGTTLDSLSEDQWDEAGRVGFKYTAEGASGVRQALDEIFASFNYAASKPGPQKIFGPLYTSLAAKRAVKDRGPITVILRDFIIERLALAEGTTVLGHVLPERRRHSAASLAQEAGLDTRLVWNALVSAGLLPREKTSCHMTVDAEEGRRIAAAIGRAIYLKGLPAALNTTRNVASQMLDDGILHPIADRSAKTRGHTSKAVDHRDVEALLARIQEIVPIVDIPNENRVSLPKAAEKARTRTGNILHLLLAGALTRAVRIHGEHGIAALRFDPEEIKPLIRKIEAIGPCPADAAGEIRVPIETALKLAADPSSPIRLKTITSRTGHHFPRVQEKSLHRFRRRFSSLPPIAEKLDMRCPDLGRALFAAGIRPVFSWKRFGADISAQ